MAQYLKLQPGGEALGGGRRAYDICLVFPYKTSSSVKFGDDPESVGQSLKAATPQQQSQMKAWEQRRNAILKSLQNCGLRVYAFYSRDRDEVFVKVGADSDKLKAAAEQMNFKLQLKDQYLGAYAEFRHDFPGRPELQFKDARRVSHIYKVHSEDEYPAPDAIFRSVDRIAIVDQVIRSKDKDCCGIDIGSMIDKGDLLHYFPLHEPRSINDLADDAFAWIRMDMHFADKVRDYFGDRVALYFLWQSWYVKWLIPPSLVGIACILVDIFAQTPDNFLAIPFCILMSVWSVFLPHFWRRQEAKFALKWGTLDMVAALEPSRPQHYGEPRINPVTGHIEPFYPWSKRIFKVLLSTTVMIVTGVILVFIIFGLFALRHIAHHSLGWHRLLFQLINSLVVESVNMAFSAVAKQLTDHENHRTDSEYESWYISKVVVFKFINSYISLYYIAFMKQNFPLFGMTMDCAHDDCMVDLSTQLGCFILVRVTLFNFVELAWPKIVLMYRSWAEQGHPCMLLRSTSHYADMSPAEEQAKKEAYSEFEDFDEALIQHGYATLFVVTTPWALVVFFFATMFEIYLDSQKVLKLYRRPVPTKARSNEPWDSAFEIYGILATFTNIAVMVFTSEMFAWLTLTEKLALFFLLEHLILGARLFLKSFVPELPGNVEVLAIKHQNLVHRCLECIGEQDTDGGRQRGHGYTDSIEVLDQDPAVNEGDEDDDVQLGNTEHSANSLCDGVRDLLKGVGCNWLAKFFVRQNRDTSVSTLQVGSGEVGPKPSESPGKIKTPAELRP